MAKAGAALLLDVGNDMLRWPLFYFEIAFLLHALSHLVVARAAGLTGATFAIGVGPRLFRFSRQGTTYQLNLLPLGAYTAISLTAGPASVARRLITVAAGPVANFILATVCFMLTAIFFGVPYATTNKIGTVAPGYPAARAGLQRGDTIVMIDGTPMADGKTVIRAIRNGGGRTLTLLIERHGRRFPIRLTPRYDARSEAWATGLSPVVVYGKFGPAHAIGWGALTTSHNITGYYRGWAGRGLDLVLNLGTPVTALNVLSQRSRIGPGTALYMLAFASTIIVAWNLIPIPPLDCGRAVLLVTEAPRWRRGRYILFAGLGLLLALIVVVL